MSFGPSKKTHFEKFVDVHPSGLAILGEVLLFALPPDGKSTLSL